MYASLVNTLAQINWQLLFVRTYTFVRTLLEVATKQTAKSTKYLVNSFSDDTYYLYTGSYVPISEKNLKPGLGSAEMTYKYNRDTKVLFSLAGSTTTDTRHHTSNISEATLVLGDLVIYDITEFFDTVEFVSATHTDFPPILAWIGIWSLESGVYLDPKKNFVLRIEMLVGSTESFPIWSQDSVVLARWKALNAPIVLRRQPEINRKVEFQSTTHDESVMNAIMSPASSMRVDLQESTLLDTPTPTPTPTATPEN
jgi:hypothetical protein